MGYPFLCAAPAESGIDTWKYAVEAAQGGAAGGEKEHSPTQLCRAQRNLTACMAGGVSPARS